MFSCNGLHDPSLSLVGLMTYEKEMNVLESPTIGHWTFITPLKLFSINCSSSLNTEVNLGTNESK